MQLFHPIDHVLSTSHSIDAPFLWSPAVDGANALPTVCALTSRRYRIGLVRRADVGDATSLLVVKSAEYFEFASACTPLASETDCSRNRWGTACEFNVNLFDSKHGFLCDRDNIVQSTNNKFGCEDAHTCRCKTGFFGRTCSLCGTRGTLETTEQVVEMSFEVEENRYISAGSDVRGVSGGYANTGRAECQSRCAGDALCKGYTVNMFSNRCWLKTRNLIANVVNTSFMAARKIGGDVKKSYACKDCVAGKSGAYCTSAGTVDCGVNGRPNAAETSCVCKEGWLGAKCDQTERTTKCASTTTKFFTGVACDIEYTKMSLKLTQWVSSEAFISDLAAAVGEEACRFFVPTSYSAGDYSSQSPIYDQQSRTYVKHRTIEFWVQDRCTSFRPGFTTQSATDTAAPSRHFALQSVPSSATSTSPLSRLMRTQRVHMRTQSDATAYEVAVKIDTLSKDESSVLFKQPTLQYTVKDSAASISPTGETSGGTTTNPGVNALARAYCTDFLQQGLCENDCNYCRNGDTSLLQDQNRFGVCRLPSKDCNCRADPSGQYTGFDCSLQFDQTGADVVNEKSIDLKDFVAKGGQWQGRLAVSSTNSQVKVTVSYSLPAGFPAGDLTLHLHLMFNDASSITPKLLENAYSLTTGAAPALTSNVKNNVVAVNSTMVRAKMRNYVAASAGLCSSSDSLSDLCDASVALAFAGPSPATRTTESDAINAELGAPHVLDLVTAEQLKNVNSHFKAVGERKMRDFRAGSLYAYHARKKTITVPVTASGGVATTGTFTVLLLKRPKENAYATKLNIFQRQNLKLQIFMEGSVLSEFDSTNSFKVVRDAMEISLEVELDDDLAPIIDIVALSMLGVMVIVSAYIIRKQRRKHGGIMNMLNAAFASGSLQGETVAQAAKKKESHKRSKKASRKAQKMRSKGGMSPLSINQILPEPVGDDGSNNFDSTNYGSDNEDANAAATRIQALQRGNVARRQIQDEHAAATRIQSLQRGKVARRRAEELRTAELRAAVGAAVEIDLKDGNGGVDGETSPLVDATGDAATGGGAGTGDGVVKPPPEEKKQSVGVFGIVTITILGAIALLGELFAMVFNLSLLHTSMNGVFEIDTFESLKKTIDEKLKQLQLG
jgi:hypothetical protein